jgi:glyoxylase-like metal-dependent hydrolase (beta-lactamase superfamily II)
MSDAPAVVCLENGQFLENCYLLADESSDEAVIVDPGEETDRFLGELDRRGWALRAIWLTHAHVDHIVGVGAVHDATGVPIHLHPDDRFLYDAVVQQAGWLGLVAAPLPPPDAHGEAGGHATVGRFRFEVRHTPGHSPGSVSFAGYGMVLAGDALFQGSIGRTDLPGGDFPTLLESIRRELLSLPDETVVHSGHGPATTVGEERATNPFLTGAARGL